MKMRNYRQNCAVAQATDLLGERWTLLIVRDLLIAPRRFSELEKRLKGMGTNLLAHRLKDMATAGLIENEAPREPYRLTEMGLGLEPVILQMVQWSLRWVRPPVDAEGLHFPDWDLLALKALFQPRADFGAPILASFVSGDWRAWARVDTAEYTFGLGEPDEPSDIDFPCLIPALRQPEAVLSLLPETQTAPARRFISAFARHA